MFVYMQQSALMREQAAEGETAEIRRLSAQQRQAVSSPPHGSDDSDVANRPTPAAKDTSKGVLLILLLGKVNGQLTLCRGQTGLHSMHAALCIAQHGWLDGLAELLCMSSCAGARRLALEADQEINVQCI